jgi:hypothetical protein
MNRIWLLPDAWGKSVAIFNPEHETFEIYPGYSEALLAQGAGREKFHLDTALFTVPSFTPDGRICYRDEWDRVRYFNGRNWLRWERKQIDAHSSLGLDGPAFFDRAGNVAVNIEGKTWEFTEAEGWHKTNFEHGLGTDVERLSLPAPTPPPGCEISHPESIVRDRMGTYWLTNRGQLYRAIPGLCLPQFSPQEHQPFIDSRTVKEVLSDLQGNVFLETSFLGNPPIREYVVLKARPPLPQTKLHATVEARGMVKLRFATQVKGKAWFTWRIDGGDWSPPTRATEATANWLAQGKHTIAAAALDERLQIDPNPPVAEVTIRVDTQAQIAALIEQLKDPNYSIRDAAVAALARQPTLALPLLQSAREKAGADQRWWIDAAIQQIKDRMAKDKQQ